MARRCEQGAKRGQDAARILAVHRHAEPVGGFLFAHLLDAFDDVTEVVAAPHRCQGAEEKAEGEGDPQVYASCALQQALLASDPRLFANPFAGRIKGTAVINSHDLALDSGFVAPAVFITDWSNCQYLVFSDMSPAFQELLAGTLVVAFNASAETIDVYYVNQRGKRSVATFSVPTAPVRPGRHG